MSVNTFLFIVGFVAVCVGVLLTLIDEGYGLILVLEGILLIFAVAHFCKLEDKEPKEIDTSSYEVYINGTEVDRDLIDISNYKKVTYDYENERVLIAIE